MIHTMNRPPPPLPPRERAPPALPPRPRNQNRQSANAPSTVEKKRNCVSRLHRAGTEFFVLSAAQEFAICPNCFESHVRGSSFVDKFESKRIVPSPAVKNGLACLFGKPRTRHVWQMAVSTGSLDGLVDYARYRQQLPECAGAHNNSGGGLKEPQLGGSYLSYVPADGAIPGMSICQTCYEDYIVPTKFASNFIINRELFSREGTLCGLSFNYVQRCLEHFDLDDDNQHAWENFCRYSKERLANSSLHCPRDLKENGLAYIYSSARTSVPGLVICRPCYLDNVSYTSFVNSWQETHTDKDIPCAFAGDSPVKTLWKTELDAGKVERFLPLAGQVLNSHCDHASSRFLLDSGEAISACGYSCHAALLDYLGLDPDQQTTSQPHTPYNMPPPSYEECSTVGGDTASIPRENSNHYYTRTTNDSTYGAGHTSGAPPPPPQRPSNTPSRRPVPTPTPPSSRSIPRPARLEPCQQQGGQTTRWWGNDSFDVCETCYHDFVKGTYFDSPHTWKHAGVKDTRICDIWSPRMRQMYMNACQQRNLGPFESAAIERSQVWQQVLPQMEQLKQTAELQRDQQQMMGAMGSFYMNMDGISGARINYGTPQVGYYHTGTGHWYNSPYASTAMHYNAMSMDTSSFNATMESSRRLAAYWAQYE